MSHPRPDPMISRVIWRGMYPLPVLTINMAVVLERAGQADAMGTTFANEYAHDPFPSSTCAMHSGNFGSPRSTLSYT
eukprot:1503655-Pyramimonas_sp.AAC.1